MPKKIRKNLSLTALLKNSILRKKCLFDEKIFPINHFANFPNSHQKNLKVYPTSRELDN
jgi:hypothetical protein